MKQMKEASQSKLPIRILGIAPYEGMKTIMEKIASERKDVDLDVYVGDLQQGLEIASNYFNNDYDVIISRGGTAELLGKSTRIPVVEVGISVYDVLRAIRLAQNYSERYAIVGFSGITLNARLLCDLLQYQIDIFTIHNPDEVQKTLRNLKKQGYQMVLCDMISNTTAKRLGLNAILITSGVESLTAAFDQAVKLADSYAHIKAKNEFLEEILRNADSNIVVLEEDGSLFFSSLTEEELEKVYPMLQKELPAVLGKKTQKYFRNIEGVQYSFLCRKLTYLEKDYAAFYFSSNSVPFVTSKYGIRYSNQQEEEDIFFNSFYSITSSANSIQGTIENINQTSFPVMLSGETGSGKEQVARIIYSRSRLKGNPLVTINCALLNDRSWNFLTNHYNSPFNDNNNTIFLKDITSLGMDRRHQLLSVIVDTNLCKRNRLIFSCTCETGEGLPEKVMDFVNELSCITLHLPPLREHVEEIPTLASLYLNTINVNMANQIIGFEPEALKLLQQYSWPSNYTQFKRVLSELALVTTTSYISREDVEELLSKEKSGQLPMKQNSRSNPSDASSGIVPDGQCLVDITMPLSEINQTIIRKVLKDVKGNQSTAAKRLGIGRSTLWRYLK